MKSKSKSQSSLETFFLDTFGPTPQNKKELEFYLKNGIASQECLEKNILLLDEEILEKYKIQIISKFGDDFFEKMTKQVKDLLSA